MRSAIMVSVLSLLVAGACTQPFGPAASRQASIGRQTWEPPPQAAGIEPVVLDVEIATPPARYLQNRQPGDEAYYATEVPAPKKRGRRFGTAPLDQIGPLDGIERDARFGSTLDISFETTDFDTNGVNNSGFFFIPPDSHAAAGPNHLVNVANTTIRFHQKDGTLDLDTSLASFFAALSPVNATFDPKVLYDQYEGRFVVVTLENRIVEGGFGSAVNEALNAMPYRGMCLRFGWPRAFVEHGSPDQLMKDAGLTGENIARHVQAALA